MATAEQQDQAANLREMAQRLAAQAETIDPTIPVDSRQRGFNAEVEASHAAAAAAAAAAATATTPAATAPAAGAAARGVATVVADAMALVNGMMGNIAPLEALIAELRSL